jgi:hypothetical protein
MENKDLIDQLTKPLNKEDIECRIGQCGASWFSLLLYKTARVDVKRLNEVFGMNWQNSFEYDSKGVLISSISAKCGDEWVTRRDVGTESKTEKEKGLYSDAFKRAGFKWGIGIELYDAPKIFIPWDMKQKSNGNFTNYTPKNFHTHLITVEKYGVSDGKVRCELSYKEKDKPSRIIFSNYQ